MAYNARIMTQYLLKTQNDENSQVQKLTHAVVAAMPSQCNYDIPLDRPPPLPASC